MQYFTFPKEYISDGGSELKPRLRNWIITWKAQDGSVCVLKLCFVSSAEALNRARELGAPVDKKWWQFWVYLNVFCEGHKRHRFITTDIS